MPKELKISKDSDPNYLATVVKLTNFKPHPNADKLEITTVFGNDIIVAKDVYTTGDNVVYFPVESTIDIKFLSWANLLDKPELNRDQNVKGFFNLKGRVRAVKLRGVHSQGFLFKTTELAKYYEMEASDFNVGDSFDVVGDHTLVSKYIPKTSKSSEVVSDLKKTRLPFWLDVSISLFPKPIRRGLHKWIYNLRNPKPFQDQIVPGQFRFHYKTEHLGKNLHLLIPDDWITVSTKLHGTSAIFANILCKKSLNVSQRVGNLLGFSYPTKEYKFVYSSRSIIKNRRDNKFTDDVWGFWAEKLEKVIPEGYLVYGEIVGFMPTGKCIQKNYDYGMKEKESQFYVYRITKVDENGNLEELSGENICIFCNNLSLKTVPVYYQGIAKNMFPIPVNENWNENFLEKLKETYLDKPCEFCTTNVVREGIVLKINSRDAKPVFKFKSPAFLLKETTDRDKGEVDMEELS